MPRKSDSLFTESLNKIPAEFNPRFSSLTGSQIIFVTSGPKYIRLQSVRGGIDG
jgi:hypothetical protein